MLCAEEIYILLGSPHIYVFASFQASWLSSVYVTDGQTLQTLLGQSRNGRLARRYTPTIITGDAEIQRASNHDG